MVVSEAQKRAEKKYRQTEKGKEVHRKTTKKYDQSDKGKVFRKLYSQTDKRKASIKRYQQTDKFKLAYKRWRQSEKGKASYLRTTYNLSLEDYEEILHQQKGRCKICSKEFNKKNPHDIGIDHNHKTGKIRGILCSKCNIALGALDDDIYKFLSAIKYLEDTKEKL